MLKLVVLSLLLTAFPLWAQNVLAPVEVKENKISPVRWNEVKETKILSGKKNKSTKTDIIPPVATDNMRQYFAQNSSITVAEQSTEPWPAFNIRGIGDPHEAQNVLLLQDGLPMPLDMYGAQGQYVVPPGPLMDEIEVLSGGAALIYGPQPGGAINFQSPRLTSDTASTAKLGLTYGSYNLFSTVNSLKGRSGRTAYWAGYYRKQGDGYQRENADFWAHHLQAKTHTFLENGSVVKFAFTGYDSDFGQPGGLTRNCSAAGKTCWDADGDNRTATREYDRLQIGRASLSAGFQQKLGDATTLETTLWGVTYKRYSTTQNGNVFGGDATGTTMANRQTDAHSVSVESRLRHDWNSGEEVNTFTAGVLSYNNNSPTTNWTGDLGSIRGDTTGRSLNQSRVLAVFAENRFSFGKLAVVPGVRYENITLSTENRLTDVDRAETFKIILGGLGTSYDLTEDQQLYANVSQGFKPVAFGTVLQQADPNVDVKGDIKPSYTYIYEAGLRGDNYDWNYDASYYWVQYQNQIATNGNEISNGGSAHYRGLETSVTKKNVLRHELHGLDLYANANFLDARFRGGQFEGRRPMYSPTTTVKYGAIYRHAEKWRTSLLGTYVSAHYSDDNRTKGANSRYIPSYQVFDLLAEARLGKGWSVNGAVNNLLDKSYYSRIRAEGILPTMGRNFYLGGSYQF